MPITSRPGQTLLETVIAAGVIVVAVIAAITLIISTINSGRVSQDRIEAANFAREGIEVVRGIRDSNWLKREQNVIDSDPVDLTDRLTVRWDDAGSINASNGINDGYIPLGSVAGKDYIAKFASANGVSGWSLELLSVNNDSSICYRAASIYYSQRASVGCTRTKFSRVITIKTVTETPSGLGLDVPALDVTVSVSWRGRTAHAPLIAQQRLYDWR